MNQSLTDKCGRSLVRQRWESVAGGHVQGTGEACKRTARLGGSLWGMSNLTSGEGFPEQVPLGYKTSSLPRGRQAQGISAVGRQGQTPQKCPDTGSNVWAESSFVGWCTGDVMDERDVKLEG